MKSRIIDWITYILNILLIIPCFGIVIAGIVGLICHVFFKSSPMDNQYCLYIAGALALGPAVAWGKYQYRIVILKQSGHKGDSKICWMVLGVFILCIFFVILGIATWHSTFNINGENYQDFTSHIRSPKRLTMAQKLVPEGSTDIAFFEKNKSFGHHIFVKCTCSEEQLQNFASKQGYAFVPKPLAISPAWQHFNPNDSELKTLPEKNLVYENIRPNGGGFYFHYDMERQILYSSWSNR